MTMTAILAALGLSLLPSPACAQKTFAPAALVSTAPANGPVLAAPKPPALRRLAEFEQPGVFEDTLNSKAGLIKAARRSLAYLAGQPAQTIRIGETDYSSAILADTLKEFLLLWEKNLPPEEFSRMVREKFDVFQSVGLDGAGRVVFSSYYQPVLDASLKRSETYRHPLYRKPDNMLEADLGEFDKKYAGEILIGRADRKARRFVPYFNRDQIDSHGALAGRGYEIAWLKDKFDVLDIHIQGSGLLRLPSGKLIMARFAATNARPFSMPGPTLIKAGVFPEGLNRDQLRQYLRDHPESQDWVVSLNPRFTFFQLVKLPPDGEPFGTMNETLTAARSIAIDQSLIPLGALAFFSTTSPQADKEGRLLGYFPNSRFALCMDTGGAIKGPGRVDIYTGHGPQAATTARGQWHDGRLYILIKKLPPRDI